MIGRRTLFRYIMKWRFVLILIFLLLFFAFKLYKPGAAQHNQGDCIRLEVDIPDRAGCGMMDKSITVGCHYKLTTTHHENITYKLQWIKGSYIESPDSLTIAESIRRNKVTLSTQLFNSYKDRTRIMHNGTLILSRLSIRDEGRYWCKVSLQLHDGYHYDDEDSFALSVNRQKTSLGVSTSMRRVSADENESISLPCSVIDVGAPSSWVARTSRVFTWYRTQQSASNKRTYEKIGSFSLVNNGTVSMVDDRFYIEAISTGDANIHATNLVIPHLQLSDSGRYFCRVTASGWPQLMVDQQSTVVRVLSYKDEYQQC